MRISHEAIYRALYVQGRGALRRELVACLRTGRACECRARAAITIRVTQVSPATTARRNPRLSLASPATLRAMICDRIVPDEVLPVILVDLSESGCAVTTSDRRVRVHDRLWLYTRFLEGEISTEIRIARITAGADAVTVGCVFVDPGPDGAVVRRVWARLRGSDGSGAPIDPTDTADK